MLFILALAVGGVLRATLGKVPGSLVTGGGGGFGGGGASGRW